MGCFICPLEQMFIEVCSGFDLIKNARQKNEWRALGKSPGPARRGLVGIQAFIHFNR
jgi:hypothetical protein